MSTGWPVCELQELATVVGRGITPAYAEEGTLVLNQKCVRNGCIDLSPARRHAANKRPVASNKLLRQGDVLVNSTGAGTLGRTAGLLALTEPMTVDSHITVVRPNEGIDARWLRYALRLNEPIIEGMAKGSTGQTELSRQLLAELRLVCPPLPHQRAIAEVLGALDDKIAANGELASTVDDLLASRFAALTAGSATTDLSTIADVNVASTKPTPEGSLRYLDIASVGVGSYELPEVIGWDTAPGRARRTLRPGDTVWSTVRPNRRSHALVLDADPLLIASTGLAVLTPKHGHFAFVYECTRTPAFTAYLESAAEGSAYPAVRGERFLEAPVPDIGDHSQRQFEQMAAPMRERAHSANVESRTLSEIRDTLLPPLMSGKIRVRDAERVVEGVV